MTTPAYQAAAAKLMAAQTAAAVVFYLATKADAGVLHVDANEWQRKIAKAAYTAASTEALAAYTAAMDAAEAAQTKA
jgi:hypothetical protein